MFYKCEELLSFKDISKLDDYNIIYINQLFSKNNYNNSNDNYNYYNENEKSDSIYDDSLALSSISLKSDIINHEIKKNFLKGILQELNTPLN